jgi:hypothetical protein
MEHQELRVFEAQVGENALQVEGVGIKVLEPGISSKAGVKMDRKPELSGLEEDVPGHKILDLFIPLPRAEFSCRAFGIYFSRLFPVRIIKPERPSVSDGDLWGMSGQSHRLSYKAAGSAKRGDHHRFSKRTQLFLRNSIESIGSVNIDKVA